MPGATGQVADEAPPRARKIVEHALEAEVLSDVLPARLTLAELDEVDVVPGPRGVLLHHLSAAAPTGRRKRRPSTAGDRQQVSAAMLVSNGEDLPQVGGWVVVHLRFALSRMDEAEAHIVLDGLQALHCLYAGELPA